MNTQFATAWVDKASGRQILVYLWENPDIGYFVQHMSQSPDFRTGYAMKFEDIVDVEHATVSKGADRAWEYFEAVRSNKDGIRGAITETLQNAFDAANLGRRL